MTLSDRVAALSGPDREVDASIEKILPCSPEFSRHHPGRQMSQWNEQAFRFYRVGDEGHEYLSPSYTASLDAALTLYHEIPDQVPSCPRKATAAALRARGL